MPVPPQPAAIGSHEGTKRTKKIERAAKRPPRREYAWLTITQACELVQVTRDTMHNWMVAKKVERRVTAGGAVRIRASSLWREDN